jgi:choline dehydrogenase-like flavoprotein
MIEDINELDEGATVSGDVCVIGTGPAGTEAIRTLRRNGLRVVVAEGGRREFSKEMQELTRVENVGREVREPDPDCKLTPYLAPEHRGEGRLRQLGGNSNIWTGKWREFEPLDFAARPHVPMSGWPFGLDELRPIYREIERDYDFGDFAAAEATAKPFEEQAGRGRLSLSFHYWEAEPLRTAQRHADEFENDPDLRVVLGANAVELMQDEDGRVTRLRCRSPEGREISIEANDFIVATGGIEAPRLLLASTGKDPRGIGNAHDLVGRYFQDHPKIKTGILHPGPNFHLLPGGAANFPRPRFKTAISLSPELQAEHGLLNHTLQFAPLPQKPPISLLGRLRARLRRSGRESGPFKAAFIVEQAPNPESRVTLSVESDALGMRKPRLDWRLSEIDVRSFDTTLSLLTEELSRAGIGRLEFQGKRPAIEDTVDCRHHIGTTRMSATPETGVVDPDGRVWGTDNLWIASSAVFPTGHSYGPTLTILAVTRKACKAILRRRRAGFAAVA